MTNLKWETMMTERGNKAKRMRIDTDLMVQKIFPLENEDNLEGMLEDITKMTYNLERCEFNDNIELELDIVRNNNFYATVTLENDIEFNAFKRDLINSLEGWWDVIDEFIEWTEE